MAYVILDQTSAAKSRGSAAAQILETIFYRASALMLPADATLSMARAATEQSARDSGDRGVLERYLSAAWADAGMR